MSIGCLGILLGAISGAGAIRDNGGMLRALDDLLTELEHDFSSLEVHVKSGNTDLQPTRLHRPVSWLQKKRQTRSKGKKKIKKVESPSVDDASMKSADLDQLQREVEAEDWPMRLAAAGSPVWRDLMQSDRARGIHLFQKLIGDSNEGVRTASAASPAWVPLLEKDPSKGTELFQKLIEDPHVRVRDASAASAAWVPLLEKDPSKGTELFQKLIGDENVRVRDASANSPAWVPLLEKDPSKGTELFQKLIGDSNEGVRAASAASPAWVALLEKDPSKGTELFQKLMADTVEYVRAISAASPAWVPLLEKDPAKGTELFQKLIGDPNVWVRRASAKSPAWVPLLEKDPSKGTELFQKLIGDEDVRVRRASANSPAWVPLLEKDPSKGTELFQKLIGDPHLEVRESSANSPAWVPLLEKDSSKGTELFQKLIGDPHLDVRKASAASAAWVPLLEKDASKGAELFQKLIGDPDRDVRKASAASAAWVPLLEKDPSKGTELFQKLIGDEEVGVRDASANSLAWVPLLEKDPSKGTELFQKLMADTAGYVRAVSAASPAWVPLLEKDPSKGTELFQKLTADTVEYVRAASAASAAWVPLLEKNVSKGTELFQKLIRDPHVRVREASAKSPAWVPLLEKDSSKGTELFEKLIGDPHLEVRESSANSPAWVPLLKADGSKWIQSLHHLESPAWTRDVCEAMTKRQDTSMNRYFQNFSTVELLEAAQLLSEASSDCMAKLGFTVALTERVRKSADSSFLSKLLQVKLWAKLAGRRLVDLIERQKKISESQREIAERLVIALLALGTLTVFSGILWYFYPAICQWRDEKALAAEAKAAIREAETYTVNISTAPEPPSHLDIFHLHLRVYANPYILHKYDLLEPVLRQAFRISQEVLAEGLRGWDFTAVRAVQRLALGGGQNLAAEAYEMARKHIEEHDLNDLHTLTQLCQQFRQSCDQYSSQLEEVSDSMEKSFKMYLQVFKAKRDFFDPLILRIADTTGAEAQLCGEKGLLRLAEKNALRPTAGLIWDPIRAMLVGHSIGELIEVLNCLRAEAELGKIKLLQVNNRFERPTSDNWQDVAIYIQFTDERFNDIVAEIQLVHQAFLAVRTKFKAHDAYDNFRFAAEALKVKEQAEIPGLPDSQRSPPPG